MLHVITAFINEKGARIDAYSEHGALFPRYVRYVGHDIGVFTTPQGKMQAPYTFDIAAPDIETAYTLYADASFAAGTKHQEDIDKQVARARLLRK